MTTKPNQFSPAPEPSLTGLVRCGHCCLPMLARQITQGQNAAICYTCPTNLDSYPTNCSTPAIPVKDLNRAVLNRITQHLTADHLAPTLIELVKQKASESLTLTATDLQQEQESLQHLHAERHELLQQIEAGELTYQEVGHLAQASAAAGKKIQAQAEVTKQKAAHCERAATDEAWIMDRTKNAATHLNRTPSPALIGLFQSLVKEITLDQTAIRVQYNIPMLVNGGRLPGNTEEITLKEGAPLY